MHVRATLFILALIAPAQGPCSRTLWPGLGPRQTALKGQTAKRLHPMLGRTRLGRQSCSKCCRMSWRRSTSRHKHCGALLTGCVCTVLNHACGQQGSLRPCKAHAMRTLRRDAHEASSKERLSHVKAVGSDRLSEWQMAERRQAQAAAEEAKRKQAADEAAARKRAAEQQEAERQRQAAAERQRRDAAAAATQAERDIVIKEVPQAKQQCAPSQGSRVLQRICEMVVEVGCDCAGKLSGSVQQPRLACQRLRRPQTRKPSTR